jgi:acyl-CoA synthetase (AMP-forming)/AMP-acid ligase II
MNTIHSKHQERFGVMEIGEFFASTEGMLTLVNHSRNDLSIGAVGHHGWLMRCKFADSYISVRLDPVTGDIWRDLVTGFAQRTPLEEGGEILIRVPEKTAWPGYWNSAPEATDSKFLENVFERGDLFYRTGDALRRTGDGYWYFMDRLGK